jgi:hypothetical protein
MTQAVLKYYYDLTKYNVVFSLLIGFVTHHAFVGILTFGTFGILVGLMCFKRFQNNQYYFYYNLGISKVKLISITCVINLFITAIILEILK